MKNREFQKTSQGTIVDNSFCNRWGIFIKEFRPCRYAKYIQLYNEKCVVQL